MRLFLHFPFKLNLLFLAQGICLNSHVNRVSLLSRLSNGYLSFLRLQKSSCVLSSRLILVIFTYLLSYLPAKIFWKGFVLYVNTYRVLAVKPAAQSLRRFIRTLELLLVPLRLSVHGKYTSVQLET